MTNLERDYSYVKYHMKKTSCAGHRHLTATKPPKATLMVSGKIQGKLKKRSKTDCHVKTSQDEDIFKGDQTFYSITAIRDEKW